ncbi:MAG: lysylphosphatidylglycerol synthase transmembrane domain-containing protein [Bacteroidota bacterium]
MKQNTVIESTFQTWRIWLAVGIGLTVMCLLLYRSVSTTSFVPTGEGKGNFSWHDLNNNGKVDTQLEAEFYPNKHGNYTKETLGGTLRSIDWSLKAFGFIALALVFMVGRDLFYIIRIRILTKNQLKWKNAFRLIMIWEFASALMPGVVGGVAVAMFILNRENITLGRSTAIVIITAFLDNLFYIVMIPIILLLAGSAELFPSDTTKEMAVQWIFWTGYCVILLLCTFLFLSIFIFPHLAKQFFSVLFRLPVLRRRKERALQTADDIATASLEFRKEPMSFWLKAFFATVASWTCRYLVINAILAAFLSLGLAQHAIILAKQFVLWLFMHISPTPGGSGVAEYAFGELLSDVSSSAILLAAMAILWRLISYFPYLFIGAIILPRWLKKTSRHRAED